MKLLKMLGIGLVCLSAAACGSSASSDGAPANPTAGTAAREFLGAYCPKLQSCAPDGFAVAYPGGVSECVQGGVDALTDAEKAAPSTCTQAEIDACVTDAGNVACADPVTSIPIPTSCSKC